MSTDKTMSGDTAMTNQEVPVVHFVGAGGADYPQRLSFGQ